MTNKIAQKIKKAPRQPGVYIFKNKKGEIIYVGRAVNLKNRLSNYLRPNDLKTQEMIKEADNLTIKKTSNLLEAIILEANLIKKHQPFYNIKEKDNRSFVYIVIPKIKWSYPRIVRGRELQKYLLSNAFIFGPLQSYSLAKNLLLLLRKVFPYSTCRINQARPCFHYQIGLCAGKCIGVITENDYQKIIESLIDFLSGQISKAKKFLQKYYPQKLNLISQIDDSILIKKEVNDIKITQKIEGYDISHFSGKNTVGSLVVFENGEFNKKAYRKFKIRTALPHDDLSALKELIERRFNHSEWPYPDLILVDGGKTQINTIEKILEKRELKIPVIGIAKFQNDKLIFGKNIKKSIKELLQLSFDILKQIRDEAHRFANQYRKALMKIKKAT
ncbi:MAG: GIY-YIG nuclease family protein [Patescibacteria group bacterium]|jgi:excinuclease ABC subunit C|nr:GIY-YIG nuclease family protein [Patescibacteria group bacterium]